METRYIITYTLYSHNLKEPWKSFDSGITLKDFNKGVNKSIKDAKRVVYINPRGTSIILKDKNGVK